MVFVGFDRAAGGKTKNRSEASDRFRLRERYRFVALAGDAHPGFRPIHRGRSRPGWLNPLLEGGFVPDASVNVVIVAFGSRSFFFRSVIRVHLPSWRQATRLRAPRSPSARKRAAYASRREPPPTWRYAPEFLIERVREFSADRAIRLRVDAGLSLRASVRDFSQGLGGYGGHRAARGFFAHRRFFGDQSARAVPLRGAGAALADRRTRRALQSAQRAT